MVPDLTASYLYVSPPAAGASGFFNHLNEPTVAFPDLPILLVPGNHDRFTDESGTPGCRNFEKIFADFWPSPLSPHLKYLILMDEDTGVRLALIAVDFCLASAADASPPAWPFHYGQGRAEQSIVADLATRTAQLREEYSDLAVVWISHFPPTPSAGDY
jgi:hypothetical protein